MSLEIKIIINDRFKSHRYRATPEEIQQNRKEIAIQRERDQRAREKAYPNTNGNATQNK